MTSILLRRIFVAVCMIANATALANIGTATPVASLSTSVLSPQPLGTSVTLTASATDTDAGTLSYRYAIGPAPGGPLSMVRDFSVDPSFVFTPMVHEGAYEFVVTARNNTTGKKGNFTITPFTFTSLVTGNSAVVTATANPLVALFSSPPCAAGGLYMRASILRSGTTSPFYTNWKTCTPGQNLNFIIAGMRAATLYGITSQTWNGTTITPGTTLGFTTGTPSVTPPTITAVTPFTPEDSSAERFTLLSPGFAPAIPMAIDLTESLVWYYLDPAGTGLEITRPVAGGTILVIAAGANSAGTKVSFQQILREIDLAGNPLRETNATRVSEQVSALSGIASNCQLGGADCLVGGFHHEALRLPNGHTLALADEEKVFTDGTQGSSPTNPVDIVGDIIIDLDKDWQVTWYWRAFDHLNANRAAVLGETCVNLSPACTPILLTAGIAQDWLHGNALYFSPSDGSVLYSMRHQDWVVKIDYGNGSGTNNILWTLGKGGSFTINSSDPYPWFSHQHDPGFVLNGTTTLALFDNGNTRVSPPPLGLGSGDSRGYVLNVDQTNMTATPVMLADLGYYSQALGTAELLSNGDYHFDAGLITGSPAPFTEEIEVFPSAVLGFTQKINAPYYRAFRMVSLYNPPDKD